jgi:hypothetical protein
LHVEDGVEDVLHEVDGPWAPAPTDIGVNLDDMAF